MPIRDKKKRKEHYDKNKDEINRKRRERAKTPEIKTRLRAADKRWRDAHRVELRKRNRVYKKRYDEGMKKKVFEHYGIKCADCGIEDMDVLSIDHINGGGREHRKKIGRKINIWLCRNNFPEGFQTLCFNCNWKKHKKTI